MSSASVSDTDSHIVDAKFVWKDLFMIGVKLVKNTYILKYLNGSLI